MADTCKIVKTGYFENTYLALSHLVGYLETRFIVFLGYTLDFQQLNSRLLTEDYKISNTHFVNLKTKRFSRYYSVYMVGN